MYTRKTSYTSLHAMQPNFMVLSLTNIFITFTTTAFFTTAFSRLRERERARKIICDVQFHTTDWI
jgi:multisubunit Na+/H+ antiporter MnhC subunit